MAAIDRDTDSEFRMAMVHLIEEVIVDGNMALEKERQRLHRMVDSSFWGIVSDLREFLDIPDPDTEVNDDEQGGELGGW